jgi:RsiW-degrading membrane proteinase PrsW (M82 family)
MHIPSLVAMAIAPGLFWLWYFYRRDQFEPEPRLLVVKVFLLGMLVTIPVALLEGLLPVSALVLAVLFAPIIEEGAKFAIVTRSVYTRPEFNETMDGIVYAVTGALGFASIENILYILTAYFTSPLEDLLVIYTMRAILSVPGHALFASVWGYALGRAKCDPEAPRGTIALGLGLAMILHGCFNFLLFGDIVLALGVFGLVPILWVLATRNIRNALKRSPFR